MEGGSVALGPEVGALPGVLGCQREAPSWRWSQANGEVSRILKGSMFDQGPFLADLMVFVEGSGYSPSYTLFLGGAVMAPGPAVDQGACEAQGCSHAAQGPARYSPIRRCLLTGEHCRPARFQQPPTLPSLHQYKAYLQNLVEE